MSDQTDTKACPPASRPTPSEDGYVRLTLQNLLATPLVHLWSGLDQEAPGSLPEGAGVTTISGYTEWISTTEPTLTLGWDWRLEVASAAPLYIRSSAPRSNIMLVDERQRDLGPRETAALLGAAINSLTWKQAIYNHINTRFV